MQKHLRERISLANPQHFLAVGFGSGLIPLMPGTFGTLAGLPLVWLLAQSSWYVYISCCLIAILVGIKVCQTTSDAMQVHDHGSIVWDEIAGILVTFILLPVNWLTLVVGFILFRLLDIIKPWPIRTFDKKIHGGLGIMLDDIVAGALACAILHVAFLFIPALGQLNA